MYQSNSLEQAKSSLTGQNEDPSALHAHQKGRAIHFNADSTNLSKTPRVKMKQVDIVFSFWWRHWIGSSQCIWHNSSKGSMLDSTDAGVGTLAEMIEKRVERLYRKCGSRKT